MSLSWRECVSIALAPDQVRLASHGRGWRGRADRQRAIPCSGPNGTAWQAALDALAKAIDAKEWQDADARVTLSNHFVRFALVRDVEKLRDQGERAAAARHQLQAIYGESIERCRIALSIGDGGTALAAAIDDELLDGIVAALRRAKLRARAVEPLLAVAFNRCRGLLARRSAWLAVSEPGRVTLAHVDRGVWQKLRSQRLSGSLSDELPVLLERSRLADGADFAAGRVLLVAREPTARVELPRAGGWSVETVLLAP